MLIVDWVGCGNITVVISELTWQINMAQVALKQVLFLLIVSLLASAAAKDETPGTDATAVASPNGNTPAKTVPQEDLKIVEGLKELDEKGYLKKIQQPMDKLEIPSDLTGKSDEELIKYAKLLYKREKKIQRRITYHLAFSAFSAFLTYLFRHSAIFLPAVAFMEGQNQGFRKTLDADWMVFQEQLADYLLEYMRLKHIDPKSLPESKMLGVPIINVKYDSDKSVDFPVWRTEKGQALPLEAGLRQMGPMLKNWWNK